MKLAAQLCGVAISTITLIDRDRQWFKAKVGLDIEDTSREVAFCALTIQQRTSLVIPDAHAAPRFAGNPLVKSNFEPASFRKPTKPIRRPNTSI